MEQLDQIINIIALTAGIGWACGINLYATLVMLGIMGATGNLALPEEMHILTNPMVIAAAGLMYFVEFTADKIPGVDSAWDGMHTFIRIPAGAFLAATAIGDASPALELSAAIIGGGLATTSHATKAGARLAINTSPEPFTNWIASVTEDVAVILGLWTALAHPWVFVVLLVLFIAFSIWLLPKIWQAIKGFFAALSRLFRGGNQEPPSLPGPPPG